MQNYARIGTFGILALIALRVGVGWHFYMEGASKVRSGGFSSEGFLQSANGPLKDNFQQLIWDHDGSLRLDQEKVNAIFTSAVDDATKHFGFTDEQRKQADRTLRRYAAVDKRRGFVGKLNDVYTESSEEIYKYWQSVDRLKEMRESDTWTQVSSLRGQKDRIEAERMSGVRGALSSIDALWQQFEGQLNDLATPEQRSSAGAFQISRPGEGPMTTSVVNKIIPIFDMVVGILLIIGLLTPLAGWAAALFLLSVVLSQMPGYPGSQPTYFQAVEALACVVLATTDAGRYAGLDFIPWSMWRSKAAKKAAVA